MTAAIVYTAMLNAVINSMSLAIMTIDNKEIISDMYIGRRPTHTLQYLIGKKILRVLKLLYRNGNAQIIYAAYQQCIKSQETVEILRFSHINVHDLSEYLSWYFSPVKDSEGQVLICIQNITESVLLEEEFTCITEQYESVNQELCVAVSNLDFHLMDLEYTHKRLGALFRITSIVQKTVNEKEVLDEILDGMTRELGLANVAILLLDEEKKQLMIKAHRGYPDNICIPLGQGITGYAALHRELVYVPDADSDPRYIKFNINKISELAIPLIVDDQVIGVLDLETSSERILETYDLDFFQSLASQIAITIAHANHVAKIEMLAITDGLTGLYNYRYFRTLLEQEFKRTVRYKRPLSYIMIDIDFFKHYNDTHGHRMGDEVLRRVAILIQETSRDVDFVVRYGGEEFVVLLPETMVDDAYIIAERIRTVVAEYPFPNKHTQPGITLTVSLGVSGYPNDAETDLELIDHADEALYLAKRSTRNCVCLYQQQ